MFDTLVRNDIVILQRMCEKVDRSKYVWHLQLPMMMHERYLNGCGDHSRKNRQAKLVLEAKKRMRCNEFHFLFLFKFGQHFDSYLATVHESSKYLSKFLIERFTKKIGISVNVRCRILTEVTPQNWSDCGPWIWLFDWLIQVMLTNHHVKYNFL